VELNETIYRYVNNGVYRCGFATSQKAYDKAFKELFAVLTELEERLQKQDYLLGDQLTALDLRLFNTLIRFDVVYYSHFKCNDWHIYDYPYLWDYVKRLYAMPSIRAVVNFSHIKEHYYGSHRHLNPSGIIPQGPSLKQLD
jgi:putative glutathione S-transferase